MPILQKNDQQAVRQRFDLEIKRDVNLTLYTQRDIGGLFIPGRECRSCEPTQQLLEELSALSPKIHLEVKDFYSSQEDAKASGVEKIPGIIIGADAGDNVRFYGLPSGFEFALLLDTIIAASNKQSPLQLETRRRLKRLRQDVHIQVFVTPTCKFCPAVARVAHAMAMESPRILTDVVEIQEFPHLRQVYQVMGVPKTVINDTLQFVGAVSEEVLLRRLLEAVGEEQPQADEAGYVSDQTTPVA